MDKTLQTVNEHITSDIALYDRALKLLLYGGTSLDRMRLFNDINAHYKKVGEENAKLLIDSILPVSL